MTKTRGCSWPSCVPAKPNISSGLCARIADLGCVETRADVHHGGAGTTAASLHAGIPMIASPLEIDQFFWGERVYKIGVGPKSIPQRSVNADALAKAIQQALQDQSMRERAKGISQALSSEDGVQAAVKVIREIV